MECDQDQRVVLPPVQIVKRVSSAQFRSVVKLMNKSPTRAPSRLETGMDGLSDACQESNQLTDRQFYIPVVKLRLSYGRG